MIQEHTQICESTEDYANGKAAGQKWAAFAPSQRTYWRLHRAIEASDGRNSTTGDADFYVSVCTNGMNHGIGYHLSQDLTGEKMSHAEANNFWCEALGDDGAELIKQPDFARGFIEGVLSSYE